MPTVLLGTQNSATFKLPVTEENPKEATSVP